eukprot:937368_1
MRCSTGADIRVSTDAQYEYMSSSAKSASFTLRKIRSSLLAKSDSEESSSLKENPLPLQHFSYSEKELIEIAKEFASKPTPESLAADFIFRGPVIGPLNKVDFVATLTAIQAKENKGLTDAFPDLELNNFGFAVDPTEPGRVWYFQRPRGTFTGPFDHPVTGRIEPTGAAYVAPPEARSVIIDEDGLIKYASVGYVTDRFTGDTTGGKGAVFGMYHVMGEEMDDTIGSWKMIGLQWLSSILPEGTVPQSFSKKNELPDWWKDERMGAQ